MCILLHTSILCVYSVLCKRYCKLWWSFSSSFEEKNKLWYSADQWECQCVLTAQGRFNKKHFPHSTDLVSSWLHSKWFISQMGASSGNDGTGFKTARPSWPICGLVYVVLAHTWTISGKQDLGQYSLRCLGSVHLSGPEKCLLCVFSPIAAGDCSSDLLKDGLHKDLTAAHRMEAER